MKPVFVGDEIEGYSEVEEIRADKKIVTFKTRVVKTGTGEVAIKGLAKVIVPSLVV